MFAFLIEEDAVAVTQFRNESDSVIGRRHVGVLVAARPAGQSNFAGPVWRNGSAACIIVLEFRLFSVYLLLPPNGRRGRRSVHEVEPQCGRTLGAWSDP